MRKSILINNYHWGNNITPLGKLSATVAGKIMNIIERKHRVKTIWFNSKVPNYEKERL